MILANVTHPVTSAARTRSRSRTRGSGHRRISHPRASVYETIEEENSNPSTPHRAVAAKKSKTEFGIPEFANDEVYIVDPETASVNTTWDDERGIVALRKYYALRDEAEVAVTESKLVWQDTPFSLFAVQCESFYMCRIFLILIAPQLSTRPHIPLECKRF
jgi:serine/arginine repetitive matrix protein 2